MPHEHALHIHFFHDFEYEDLPLLVISDKQEMLICIIFSQFHGHAANFEFELMFRQKLKAICLLIEYPEADSIVVTSSHDTISHLMDVDDVSDVSWVDRRIYLRDLILGHLHYV